MLIFMYTTKPQCLNFVFGGGGGGGGGGGKRGGRGEGGGGPGKGTIVFLFERLSECVFFSLVFQGLLSTVVDTWQKAELLTKLCNVFVFQKRNFHHVVHCKSMRCSEREKVNLLEE